MFKRFRDFFRWSAVGFGALAVVALLGGQVRAQAVNETFDLWQTVQARKLLMDDPQLGPLDLGVQVTSRVAVLWGPVPSRELAYRAEQRLRTLYDLVEVRNRLTLDSDGAAPWA